MSKNSSLYFFVVFFAVACGRPEAVKTSKGSTGNSVMCDMSAKAAISVQVRLPQGANGNGLTIEVSSKEGFHDQVQLKTSDFDASGIASVGTAFEQPGTFSVSVSHPSFGTQMKDGIVVTKGECHVGGQAVQFAF